MIRIKYIKITNENDNEKQECKFCGDYEATINVLKRENYRNEDRVDNTEESLDIRNEQLNKVLSLLTKETQRKRDAYATIEVLKRELDEKDLIKEYQEDEDYTLTLEEVKFLLNKQEKEFKEENTMDEKLKQEIKELKQELAVAYAMLDTRE